MGLKRAQSPRFRFRACGPKPDKPYGTSLADVAGDLRTRSLATCSSFGLRALGLGFSGLGFRV